jgi:hypothetical protein
MTTQDTGFDLELTRRKLLAAAGLQEGPLSRRRRRCVCGLAVASRTRGLVAMRRQAGANRHGREAAEE